MTRKHIVFEGLDYSGKSSVLDNVSNTLYRDNNSAYILRYPSDADQSIVKAAFSNHDRLTTATMMLLSTYYGILNTIKSDYTKRDILLDRSFLSCFAYNCKTNMDIRNIFTILKDISDNEKSIIPDYIFYFECDDYTLKQRYSNRQEAEEEYKKKYDQDVLQKFSQYRQRYEYILDLWKRTYPTIITRVDTTALSVEEATNLVIKTLKG